MSFIDNKIENKLGNLRFSFIEENLFKSKAFSSIKLLLKTNKFNSKRFQFISIKIQQGGNWKPVTGNEK